MATKAYHASDALIYADGVDYTGQSNSVSINLTISGADSSAFQEDWDESVEGTGAWTAQFAGFSAADGSAGVTDTLFALKASSPFTFHTYPQGKGADHHYFYGTARLASMPITANRNDNVRYQASLVGIGQLYNFADS